MLPITDEMNELVAKADKEIQRLREWFKDNSDAFDMMDLKLHDLSFYMYEDFAKDFPNANKKYNSDDLFNWFCEEEYENLDNWCEEETGWELRKYQTYIGRTSKFYLHERDIFVLYRNEIDWFDSMNAIMEHFWNSNGCEIEFDEDGDIDIEKTFDREIDYAYESEEGLIDAIREELEFINDHMFDDVTKYFEDILKVYKYIKDFKTNQIENFKEWVSAYEDLAKIEIDEANRYAAERIKICDQFEDKAIFSMMINSNVSNEGIQYLVDVMKGDKA